MGSGACMAFALPLMSAKDSPFVAAQPGFRKPLSMYINWAAYDELSDDVMLNEELAMKQLDEMIRLKKSGLQLDYYLMDAFWFEAEGGYRQWRKESWPNGGDAWLEKCNNHDIKPGLWISTNWMVAGGNDYQFLKVIPEWEDSLSVSGKSLCLFEGGYLPHLLDSLDMHARNGIKAFKFDFADFTAVTAASAGKLSEEEIHEKNETALIEGFSEFRKNHPDVILMAYNGYGGQYNNTYEPFKKTVDEKWLQVFDSLYCGDPRLSDVPTYNFWRSKDIYTDHMVSNYLYNDIPYRRIDNCGFMIGTTGTCYFRGKKAWKGMLILSAARGGYLNTYYGNLDLLTDEEGKWFAKVQDLFYSLQAKGDFSTVGGLPGDGDVYGYSYHTKDGNVSVLVNPSQQFSDYSLPEDLKYSLLFHDAGYTAKLANGTISLGPEQLVVIGSGEYAKPKYELGTGDYNNIPDKIEPIKLAVRQKTGNELTATFMPEEESAYRFIFQIFTPDGSPKRLSGGSPPNGIKLDELLTIEATQNQKPLTLELEYDKAIWSGLSWACAEMKPGTFVAGVPVDISFQAVSKEDLNISAQASCVSYQA
jgi:hypothetical protein